MGSKSHNTYIPDNNPDSIDDVDIMGVCVDDKSGYIGLRKTTQQKDVQYREWDSVVYELQKYVRLLLKQNPNVLGLLWLPKDCYIHVSRYGQMLIDNRNIFSSNAIYKSFIGYAHDQCKNMRSWAFKGYMGEKRKALVEKWGYDCKNASHLIRLLRMGIEFLNYGILTVYRDDAEDLIANELPNH